MKHPVFILLLFVGRTVCFSQIQSFITINYSPEFIYTDNRNIGDTLKHDFRVYNFDTSYSVQCSKDLVKIDNYRVGPHLVSILIKPDKKKDSTGFLVPFIDDTANFFNFHLYIDSLGTKDEYGSQKMYLKIDKKENVFSDSRDSYYLIGHKRRFEISYTAFSFITLYPASMPPYETIGWTYSAGFGDTSAIYQRPWDFKIEDIIWRKSFRFNNIHFYFDKENCFEECFSTLDSIAGWMIKYPDQYIEIGTHVDTRWSDMMSYCPTQKRAQYLKTYLVQKGIDEARIIAKGYCKSQPIYSEEYIESLGQELQEEYHSLNRRVEIKILPPPY